MSESKQKISNSDNKLFPALWVQNHGDYLYNFAYSRVQSKELAEDLVQETFVAALKAANSFQGKSSEITWLISILKRKVIDYYRKASTKKEIPSSHFSVPFHKDGSKEGEWILDRAPKIWPSDLDDPIHQEEFRDILTTCLGQLPDKWKAVFVLKFMEDATSEEVCKELDCTPSNLWVMLHRARLKLRECMEMNWLK